MPHLPLMRWDFQDQLQASARQVVNGGTPETTYYVYDAAGQRVRKVTERQAATGQTPTRMNERIYLGGFEIYREYESDGATRDAWSARRCTSWTTSSASPWSRRARRATTAHLRSLSATSSAITSARRAWSWMQDAAIISYEEFHPYGSTSYQAGRSVAEVSLKRYRYTGKERDEETGLDYHGARYYAPWLGRWTAADPMRLGDGCEPVFVRRREPY